MRGIFPKTALGWLGFVVLLFWIGQAFGGLLPASLWYEVNRVAVIEPVYDGDEINLSVSREVKRPFDGEYDVIIVDEQTNSIVCENGGSLRYEPDRTLPKPLTLRWWINKECDLPPSEYYMVTRWKIEWSPFEFLDKHAMAETYFSVLPNIQQSYAPTVEPLVGVQVEMQQQAIEELVEQVQELSTKLENLK